MFNPFQAAQQAGEMLGNVRQTMKNPMGAMLNRIMSNQLDNFKKTNPQLYEKGMSMIQGKDDEALKTMAFNLAKQWGIDLNQLMEQFGMKLK